VSESSIEFQGPGLTLDEWRRLACIIDFMALTDVRWRSASFKGNWAFLYSELPVPHETVIACTNIGIKSVDARKLLAALEAAHDRP